MRPAPKGRRALGPLKRAARADQERLARLGARQPRSRGIALLLTLVTASAILAACGSGGSPSTAGSQKTNTTAKPTQGGSVTVLENENLFTFPGSMDPPEDKSAASDLDYLDPVYGSLFYQGLNGKIIYGLATGYKYLAGGTELAIYLRHGVTFQDGTAFNAAAVAFNIRRDLEPKYTCTCATEMPVKDVTTSGNYTVLLHLTRPDNQVIPAFFADVPNWIVSPTALQKEGEKAFAKDPIGAGPFEIAKYVQGTEIVFKPNPNYWQKGHPYLSQLTIKLIGSDASAYDALITGEAQVYQIYNTYSTLKNVAKHVNVTPQPAEYGPFILLLNSAKPPFNNILAREAIYYATNPAAINESVADGYGVLSQSLSSPGSLFEELKVPGYRTYNLAKAKALVQQLGGLTISNVALNTPGEELFSEALKSEWAQAGIKTTLDFGNLTYLVQSLNSGKWTASLGRYGGSDPGLFTGLPLVMHFAIPNDKTLQAMALKASEALSKSAESQDYRAIYKYISDKAYLPVLFSIPFESLSVHGVSGPGLTTTLYQVLWQDVSRKAS